MQSLFYFFWQIVSSKQFEIQKIKYRQRITITDSVKIHSIYRRFRTEMSPSASLDMAATTCFLNSILTTLARKAYHLMFASFSATWKHIFWIKHIGRQSYRSLHSLEYEFGLNWAPKNRQIKQRGKEAKNRECGMREQARKEYTRADDREMRCIDHE